MRLTTTAPKPFAVPVTPATGVVAPSARTILLVSGILSAVLYAAMTVFVAMQWEGYSSASQTVSELSAIGAPTRRLWVFLVPVYAALVVAFGCGIWGSSRSNGPLHVVGGVMIADGLLGFAWPPMHLREVLAAGGGTLTDTLHLVFSAAAVLLMLLAIGFGAAAFGKRFRLYSIATMAILGTFGALTALDAPRVAANLPTPWAGVWERLNIAAYLLWVVVLATVLLRTSSEPAAPGAST